MQILRNIYQVGGSLNGMTWTGNDASYDDGSVYVLETEQGLILFDCGRGDTLDQIYARMQYWDLSPQDIKACFITHAHYDHAGAAHLLQEQGVELFAHANTVDAVAAGDERCCGYLYHEAFVPCIISNRLYDSDVVDIMGVEISIMHLPGHTQGCSAYVFEHEGKIVVVSGDIIGTLLDGYFGWSGSWDFDRQTYIESLRRFARFESDIMLPGHGMVYFHKPRRRVEEAFNQALMQWR